MLPTLGQRGTSLSRLSCSHSGLYADTVSVFRLVRLTLGWHAKEAKAQSSGGNKTRRRVDEGGKHEPLLGEQRDAVGRREKEEDAVARLGEGEKRRRRRRRRRRRKVERRSRVLDEGWKRINENEKTG